LIFFDFLDDIVFHSLLKPEVIERERGVIIEELNMYQDTPMVQVEEVFERWALGNNPLGWEIIGNKETVMQLKREDFLAYQKQFFSPKNMVFALAGGLKRTDWEKVIALADKHLGCEKGDPVKKRKINWRSPQKKVFWKEKPTEQLHLVFGRPIFAINDPRRYCLALLAIILAGNTSSRLWRKIREERGWAYYLHYFTDYFRETGVFALRVGLARSHLAEAIEIIKAELSRLPRTLVQEELDRAKDFWLGRTAIALETPNQIADLVASSWLLCDRLDTVEREIEQIKSVTLAQARDLADQLFKPDQFYLTVIGPKEKI